MLPKLEGYKTHATQAIAVVIALGAFIFGPFEVGPVHIPKITFDEMIQVLQIGGGLSFLRMAMSKKENEK